MTDTPSNPEAPEPTFTESEVKLIVDEAIRQHVAAMFKAAMPKPVAYEYPEEEARMVVLHEDLYMTIVAHLPETNRTPRSIEEIRQDVAAARAENAAADRG